jgi:hypothetical protein
MDAQQWLCRWTRRAVRCAEKDHPRVGWLPPDPNDTSRVVEPEPDLDAGGSPLLVLRAGLGGVIAARTVAVSKFPFSTASQFPLLAQLFARNVREPFFLECTFWTNRVIHL